MSIDIATAKTSPFEPTKQHARLAGLAGSWKGTTATTFEPGKPAEESAVELKVECVLGGRFLRIQYESVVMGKAHAGQMLVAYEKDDDRWSIAWIDSFHTGSALTVSTSEKSPSVDAPINVLGSYAAGDQRWGWRTIVHPSPESFLIEMLNIDPQGTEYPALSTKLVRA